MGIKNLWMIYDNTYIQIKLTKLSIDELKTFKKFNREFLPKIKKLDFNFADMKKGCFM